MRALVLLNPTAGTVVAPHAEAVARALEDAGVRACVRTAHGRDLVAAARHAVGEGAEVVVAAGGDGTVSAIAGALAGSPVPLGVLPMGTLNHFAKDLGIPLSLPAAARVIGAGNVRRVDVAEVNGRRFINNSSIGLYPHIVMGRDQQCQQLGRNKWIAMLLAGIQVFRRYPVVSVVLETNGQVLPRTTPFVFIGNNRYDMHLLALGARARMDGGELSVYSAHRTGRFGLVRLMFRALLGRLDQARDFDVLSTTNVRIDTRKRALHVSMDGEVQVLEPPLRYRILPKALKVLAPALE